MHPHLLLKFAILFAGLLVLLAERGRRGQGSPLVRGVVAALALGNLLVLAALVASHLRSPFENEVMEFAVLQHASRLLHGLPVYPPPGPEFVALAYNPLYYILAAPFMLAFGESLLVLRALSVLAFVGSILVVGFVVRGRSGSGWWGLIGAGLFAAAYKAMDSYLDTAHSDGWMLFCVLAGTWTLARARGEAGRLGGTLLLVLAFWFKQHGALFALGGVAFLVTRDGWRRALPSGLMALLLGPVLYLAGGKALFGPEFHRFTWEIPRGWSSYDLSAVGRLTTFVALWYAVPAVVAVLAWAEQARRRWRGMDAWTFQLVPAVLSGVMGTLDAGSSNNVFIPMGTWFLLVGTLVMARLAMDARDGRFQVAQVVFAFAMLAYNPLPLMSSPRAPAATAELVELIRGLPGDVYAPWIGQFPSGYRFAPAAHLVAVEDWIGRHGTGAEPELKQMMAPALAPDGEAWVLANTRLESYACFTPLRGSYRLVEDFGDRFKELECVPRRWYQAWPRYLYHHEPASAALPADDPSGPLSVAGGEAWRSGRPSPRATMRLRVP